MLMPGRSGSLIQGEWIEGGNAVLANLTVDDRTGNQPIEYVATESIEFLSSFESGDGDAFVAYIDPEATIGSGSEGSGLYRYGFNGKENDNDVKGEGNQQDYGMRIYDGRLGRFLSVDPLAKSFSWYSSYQFAGNKPIKFIDLDGTEEATPEDRSRAQMYLQNTISSYVTKYAANRAFMNIAPEKMLNELSTAIDNPGSMSKKASPVGNLCGVYAFSYIFALYDPESFVKGVSSLYIQGEGEIGNLNIKAEYKLRNPSGASLAQLENQSLPSFIFGASVRSHYNQFTSYGNSQWGATNSTTMKAWLQDRLNVKVSEFDYGSEYLADGITSKDLQVLSDHLNSGKHAMIRVNGAQYNRQTTNITALGGDVPGGDHWAVLSGSMQINEQNQTVTFTGFDMNEGLKTSTFSKKQFKDMINHVLLVERKEK